MGKKLLQLVLALAVIGLACVFEIRPCEGARTGDVETDDGFGARLKLRSGELGRLAVEDAEMEKANGEIPCDSMPVI